MAGGLVARGLEREYKVPGRTLSILCGVDLDLAPGSSLAIVGRSGAGKSTLLHVLGLLDRPTRGSLTIDGEDVLKGRRSLRDRMRREHIGFVFQFYHLLQELTAEQNVLLSGMVGRSPREWWGRRKEEREKARALLERVGLKDRIRHPPSRLSGGERQRVAIARALFRQPHLLLCDEPTGNLDERTASEVEDLLLDLHGERSMILVLVTHSLRLARRLDKIQTLEHGMLRDLAEGEVD